MVRRVSAGQAGQSLIEFAIIVVVLMLIVVGIIDFSRAVYARNVIANAAREAARYGATQPQDTAGIYQKARAVMAGLDGDQLVVAVTYPGVEQIQVDVTYTFHPVSPLIGRYLDGGSGTGLVLRSRSLMSTE